MSEGIAPTLKEGISDFHNVFFFILNQAVCMVFALKYTTDVRGKWFR